MARLTVKLRGEEVTKITMEAGNEYIAGRAQDAQIALAGERGISRHHLKFYERDGVWVCESLSKFVLIQIGTQSLEVLELSEPAVFTVPPYEFYFEPDAQAAAADNAAAAESSQKPSENLPVFYQPRINQVSDDTSPKLNNEATVAGVAALVPYFRISYPNTADDEVLKLEGQLWVAGRDPDCEIPIDSPHVSRKHFELARTVEGFFITDLGSSNGTKINGQRIPAHEPTRIESGDEIRVMNVSMSFEIRDTHFSNRMENLPVPAFDPMLAAPPVPWYPHEMNLPAHYMGGAAVAELEEMPKGLAALHPRYLKTHWKKNKVRVILVALIPVIFAFALMPSKPKPERNPDSAGGLSANFDKLTPEQKNVVKDSFNLARSLYVQGKYELCLAEVAKVHELIPQFENSKELQSFCEQGRELVIRQKDADRKEKERLAIESQISGYVEACKAKLAVYASVDETRQCLAEAMELDPEHSLIVEMIQNAQSREQERKLLAEEKEKENRRRAKGQAHYQKARGLWKSGKLSKAVNEYERFLDTPYPKIDGEKSAARRELASIKTELKTKVDTLVDQCKQLGAKGKYRDAYIACDKAVDEDPGNDDAKEVRNSMHNELKREMKNIYEDSVLEESLGNVDSAKEKWRRIMKENLDFDEYTKKARSKLKRYGIN